MTKYQLFLEEYATPTTIFSSIGHYSSPTTDTLMTSVRGESGAEGSNPFLMMHHPSQMMTSGLHTNSNNKEPMMMVGSSKGGPETVVSSTSSFSSTTSTNLGGVVYGGGGKRNLTISPSETSWIIPDLLPFTNYSVRVSAVNSLGMSEPSAPLSFVTEEEGKYE